MTGRSQPLQEAGECPHRILPARASGRTGQHLCSALGHPALPFALKLEGSESVQTFRLVFLPRGAAWCRRRATCGLLLRTSRGVPACSRTSPRRPRPGACTLLTADEFEVPEMAPWAGCHVFVKAD